MRKKHSGEIVSEKNLEIPIDSFKEKLELCRYDWKLWIDRDHIDKKSIIAEIPFPLKFSAR